MPTYSVDFLGKADCTQVVFSMYIHEIFGCQKSYLLHLMFYGIDTNKDDTSVAPAGRLAIIYVESRAFTTMKQRLNEQLEVALGERLGKTPSFATNFLWQVNVHLYHIICTQ